MAQAPRIPELDALRGIAATGVVVFHLVGDNEFLGTRDNPLTHLGSYGVHLFFLISGFVILMTVEHKARPLDFFVARVGRLYPTYWTAVLFVSVLTAAGAVPEETVTLKQVLVNLTMLQSFALVPDVDGTYWTLAHELAFYVWMLTVMWAGLVPRVEAVCAAWLGLAGVHLLALRTGMVNTHVRIETILLLRYGHLFVAGMMFYRLRSAGQTWQRHAILAGAALYQLGRGPPKTTVMVLLFFLVFYAVAWRKLSALAVRPLVFLGSISYALYAIHENAGSALLYALHGLGVHAWLSLCLTLITFLALAWAVTVFIERPGMRFVQRRWALVKEAHLRRREGATETLR